jgi:hypothetical protein
MAGKLKGPHVLLVEGQDDLFVTANIWKKHGFPEKYFHIEPMGGIDPLLRDVGTIINTTSNLENLGILIDADTIQGRRWRQISEKLKEQGYTIPPQPNKGGTILPPQPDKPRIGIWIMPNNIGTGALEDFLTFLVPDPFNDELWKLSEHCVDEAIQRNIKIPKTKARIHTYLAWKEDSGVPLGWAIDLSYLDINKSQAIEYRDWLKTLFSLP